jgi:hypothetical protein
VAPPGHAPAASGQGEPLSVGEGLRLLLGTDSRRGLAAALGVPKSRVETWARSVREPDAAVPAASLNGSAADA